MSTTETETEPGYMAKRAARRQNERQGNKRSGKEEEEEGSEGGGDWSWPWNWHSVQMVARAVTTTAENIVQAVTTTVKNTVQAVTTTVQNAVQAVTTTVQDAVQAVTTTVGDVAQAMTTTVTVTVQNFAQAVSSSVKFFFQVVSTTLVDLLSNPSMAAGKLQRYLHDFADKKFVKPFRVAYKKSPFFTVFSVVAHLALCYAFGAFAPANLHVCAFPGVHAFLHWIGVYSHFHPPFHAIFFFLESFAFSCWSAGFISALWGLPARCLVLMSSLPVEGLMYGLVTLAAKAFVIILSYLGGYAIEVTLVTATIFSFFAYLAYAKNGADLASSYFPREHVD